VRGNVYKLGESVAAAVTANLMWNINMRVQTSNSQKIRKNFHTRPVDTFVRNCAGARGRGGRNAWRDCCNVATGEKLAPCFIELALAIRAIFVTSTLVGQTGDACE
jgi:hypothetical protein